MTTGNDQDAHRVDSRHSLLRLSYRMFIVTRRTQFVPVSAERMTCLNSNGSDMPLINAFGHLPHDYFGHMFKPVVFVFVGFGLLVEFSTLTLSSAFLLLFLRHLVASLQLFA